MRNEIKRKLLPIFMISFLIGCLFVQAEISKINEFIVQNLDTAMSFGLGLGGIVGFKSFKDL